MDARIRQNDEKGFSIYFYHPISILTSIFTRHLKFLNTEFHFAFVLNVKNGIRWSLVSYACNVCWFHSKNIQIHRLTTPDAALNSNTTYKYLLQLMMISVLHSYFLLLFLLSLALFEFTLHAKCNQKLWHSQFFIATKKTRNEYFFFFYKQISILNWNQSISNSRFWSGIMWMQFTSVLENIAYKNTFHVCVSEKQFMQHCVCMWLLLNEI